MSTQGQVLRHARNGRRRKGVLDHNVPPVENQEQAGGPALSVDHGVQGNVPTIPLVPGGQVHQLAGSTLPAPIDVEELDDDVVISPPTTFEEAKKKSRRRALAIDLDAEEVAISLGLNQETSIEEVLLRETIGFDSPISILKPKGSAYSFSQQKTINLLCVLETIRLLINESSEVDPTKQIDKSTNKTVLAQRKLLDHLLMLGVESQWASLVVRCADNYRTW